ncbi:Hypothetical predicted protein [Lynx pardinus]|uniref:Uncharacterized protein n=1 Tax=Lynx pardinus TaxID=191816 RepID=A0A485MK70_LYNPA|nr:Hypothetical predicted protein [Lynx pardinus]
MAQPIKMQAAKMQTMVGSFQPGKVQARMESVLAKEQTTSSGVADTAMTYCAVSGPCSVSALAFWMSTR